VNVQRNNNEFTLKIAKKIKQIRLEKGITQEQFFFDTGIHIGRIETSSYNLRIETIRIICTYFNITIQDFFKDLG
jgi:transcriptional regulator with XRE-family HTH domain